LLSTFLPADSLGQIATLCQNDSTPGFQIVRDAAIQDLRSISMQF